VRELVSLFNLLSLGGKVDSWTATSAQGIFMRNLFVLVVVVVGFVSPALAQSPPPDWTTKMLKQEPPIGQLPHGAKVLVDDRTCPAGQIKQVIGGNVATGQPRQRSCIKVENAPPD
jgi:hypothetical protein